MESTQPSMHIIKGADHICVKCGGNLLSPLVTSECPAKVRAREFGRSGRRYAGTVDVGMCDPDYLEMRKLPDAPGAIEWLDDKEFSFEPPPSMPKFSNWMGITNSILSEAGKRKTAPEVEMRQRELYPELEKIGRIIRVQMHASMLMTLWRLKRHLKFNPSLDDIFAHIGRVFLLAIWK